MAKLFWRYCAMGSSKTANALMVRYNYIEKGQRVIMLKPRKENRDGENIIKSRIGLQAECIFVEDFIQYVKDNWIPLYHVEVEVEPGCLTDEQIWRVVDRCEDWRLFSAVIVDEAQFLTEEQVDFLTDVVDKFNIPVICYGLRTDFQGKFFEGSKRLMEVADVIEEIPTVCWCSKRAQFNARICDGKIVRDGEQVMMGGNESYVSLCRHHYKTGQLKAD
jgi:thymidine kinase